MFPTPHTVQVVTPVDGTDYDDFGNPIPAEPTTAEVPVYGWAPAGTFETMNGVQSQTTADLDLYAPPTFTVTPDARVIVGGEEYEVEGEVEDYNHGPFDFQPGVRVSLKKWSG